jgi:four helix bundle protein
MGRYIQIAMGSGAEVTCHLLLARDLGMMGTPEYTFLSSSTTEVLRMLSTLSAKLKQDRVDRSKLRANS